MISKRFYIIFVSIVLVVAVSVLATKSPTSSANKYQEAISNGQVFLQALIKEQSIPGASIAVAVNGEMVWSEPFGYADLQNRKPVTVNTEFRLGSVCKLLTVAAAAKLFETGRLDWDVPVQRYVRSFPEKDFPITPRLLSGHLAGIRHYGRDEYINRQHYETILETLGIFQNDPLVHPPGTKYFYSSYGFNLLSAVIEGASGQPFLTYMQQTVFDSLGMKNTAPDNGTASSKTSLFYTKDDNDQIVQAPPVDLSDRYGSGGFVSTAEDTVRFGTAHMSGDFFKPETRRLLLTSQKTTDGKATGVGMAWRVGQDEAGRRIAHHGGDSVGGRAFLLVSPDHNTALAFVCNLTFARFVEKDAMAVAEPFLTSLQAQ